MIEIVKVMEIHPVGAYRLRVVFSDGRHGVHDFAAMLAEGGPMVEPLREEACFARVFVQNGVPAWPNGFDIDAIALHQEMMALGELSPRFAPVV